VEVVVVVTLATRGFLRPFLASARRFAAWIRSCAETGLSSPDERVDSSSMMRTGRVIGTRSWARGAVFQVIAQASLARSLLSGLCVALLGSPLIWSSMRPVLPRVVVKLVDGVPLMLLVLSSNPVYQAILANRPI
jgi:hypothetical protein